MPKLPGREWKPSIPRLDGLLLDQMLVFVPGNRKFKCGHCGTVFDTYGEPYGAHVVHQSDLRVRLGYLCGECIQKIP